MKDIFISLFILFIIFLTFLFRYLKPKIKGIVGENQVSGVLRKLGKDYVVIHNVKLNIRGSLSQIDHVVVSDYGVFVIETKNYKGWILGYENSQNWTQVIYKYKNKFYNPVLQNRGHIYALKYLLKEYQNLEFISIIVFSNKTTLKTKTSTHVIYLNKLLKTISQYNEIRISEKVKQEIVSKIYSNNLSIKANRKIQSPKDILQMNCPRCSGVLIERYGKYGSFYGCSNYPACKFTRD
ncbi:NERD domain-containing protein [Moheibacter lacus]|uniref:NERD domain-containing protein n=1 Tax=Moheibacter lacus TaxID=2745851 RepID=A0A838ZTP8_9FLAO|nr:NERD domain-containing protein [Moheibacter lacus]MBA5630342.1 NERD domain-containing protein [Moheibacter lacus]